MDEVTLRRMTVAEFFDWEPGDLSRPRIHATALSTTALSAAAFTAAPTSSPGVTSCIVIAVPGLDPRIDPAIQATGELLRITNKIGALRPSGLTPI